jgi:hypothetical protein
MHAFSRVKLFSGSPSDQAQLSGTDEPTVRLPLLAARSSQDPGVLMVGQDRRANPQCARICLTP